MARCLPAVLLALVAAGCAVAPRAPEPAEVRAARQAALLALEHWEVRGRLAVRSPQGGGQGNLRWTQEGDHALIRLTGPFGAGATEFAWTPERLTVTSKDGQVSLDYPGPGGAEAFLAEQLGWTFPVVSTRYWLRGLADPAAAAVEARDGEGRLTSLEQHGWQVQYEEYVRRAAWWLPRRLVMESPRGRLRLVIDAWELPAS